MLNLLKSHGCFHCRASKGGPLMPKRRIRARAGVMLASTWGNSPWKNEHVNGRSSGSNLPSGYVKIAIENGHRNSGFSHETW